MPSWMLPAIVMFLVGDALVVAWVLRTKLAAGGIDFAKLQALSKFAHERIGEYLRANYSGNPDQLPAALAGLMPIVAGIAQENGFQLDTATLQLLVKASVVRHRIATRAELERAFATLRETERASRAA